MTLKIIIDEANCGATGNCVYWAPNTFDLGDDGVAKVVDPNGDTPDLIRLAADNCPLKVITLIESDD